MTFVTTFLKCAKAEIVFTIFDGVVFLEKKVIFAIIALAVILVLAAFFGLNGNNEKQITIGATLPLTGGAANFGAEVKNGINLAVKEVNLAGGINGKPISVIFEDDQCDPKQAAGTVTKLVSSDNVKIILGPFCSGASFAAAPIAEKNNAILMSGSATNSKLADFPLYFRTIPSDAFQGKYGAEYAFNKMKKRKAAIVFGQNDYAIGLRDSFKQRFQELGGTVSLEEGFVESSLDLRDIISKVKNSNADFVYLIPAGTAPNGAYFLKQASELGLTLPVLSTEVMEDQQVLDIAGSTAEGVVFTTTFAAKNPEFEKKYTAEFGKEPGAYDAFYYDGVNILANAMKACGEDTKCIQQFLINMPAFDGASGKTKFNSQGDAVGKEFTIKTVKDGKFVKLEN